MKALPTQAPLYAQPPQSKSGDKELTLNQDYYVSYRNNWDAGTASAILTGTGNYTGSVTKDFTIKPLDISRYSASLSQYSYTSDGTEKCPNVTVTYGDKTLAAGTDFTVSYKDNVKEGTATVTITGAGNYTGIINTTFTITAAPGKDDSDAGKDDSGKDDSGKDDSGKDDSGKDDSGKDDSGKDDSGKDDSGKDDSGKDNSGKDDSGKDNSGKDNSGKDDSDKGNQNSSMKKAKTLTVKGSATRATLKKLVSKKKYYVRIRTYKVVSGKKYYSKWSSKKSVKIR